MNKIDRWRIRKLWQCVQNPRWQRKRGELGLELRNTRIECPEWSLRNSSRAGFVDSDGLWRDHCAMRRWTQVRRRLGHQLRGFCRISTNCWSSQLLSSKSIATAINRCNPMTSALLLQMKSHASRSKLRYVSAFKPSIEHKTEVSLTSCCHG